MSAAASDMSGKQAQPEDATPAWLTYALAERATEHSLEVDGARIVYRVWREELRASALETVLLVHGGASNSHCWDHLAPLLPADRRVVAIDLSGHGASDRRENYDLPVWQREVLAVAQALGDTKTIILIAHSMGGKIATRLQAQENFAGLIMVDTPFRRAESKLTAFRMMRSNRTSRAYATREEAVAAFRMEALRAPVLPALMRHYALHSIHQIPRGWTWSFDSPVFGFTDMTIDLLEPLRCPSIILRAEQGFLDQKMLAAMIDRLKGTARIIDIPGAGHHCMLDQPAALLMAMNGVLQAWATPLA